MLCIGDPVDKVRSNINKVNDKFVALKNTLRHELENPTDGTEPVSVSDAVDKIMNSPTADWESHESAILMKSSGQLRDSKNVQGVLDCLGLDWDYLNPDIYEVIIEDFSLHCLEEQLAKYKEELEQFMDETPVNTFSAVVGKKKPKKIPKEFKELVTHHKWKPPVYLKDVEIFRREVASEYKLRRCAVFVSALGVKSVIVTLLVPVTIETQLESTTPEFLMNHSIVRMEYNEELSIQVCNCMEHMQFYSSCVCSL